MKNRQSNYFEIIELDNPFPNPLIVKDKYKDIMNRIAEETGFQNLDVDDEETEAKTDDKTGKKKKNKKKKKKTKKEKKE